MKTRLFVLPLLAFALGCDSATAQPTYKSLTPLDYKAPKADLEMWAQRLKQFCPREGWTVKVEGNDILIECQKRVRFRQDALNLPPDGPIGARPYYEDDYRLKLQFAPLLSQARFEELLVENEALELEKEKLKKKYNIRQRFGTIYAFTDQEKANKQAYFEESKKLVFHILPDFYTPEYSIKLINPAAPLHHLDSGDEKLDEECNQVEEKVSSHFGEYDKLAIYPVRFPVPTPPNVESKFSLVPVPPPPSKNQP